MYKKVGGIMQPIDFDIREKVLNDQGNIVISASAGTGKTHTTIERIKADIIRNENYQTFAAITFTNKASKEIKNRLGPNKGLGFVGTNDNFILSEIIQPFMYDVYGDECKEIIKPDYSNENQINNPVEGIEKIKTTSTMCKLSNQRRNFPFILALDILNKSDSARKYLISKFYRIYIDEYQDSDVDMHSLFLYICDELHIPLFIVGDVKQSIYGWRGTNKAGFISLFTKVGFTKYELRHNFRSNIQIQNYSNSFIDDVRHYYRKAELIDEVQLFEYLAEGEAIEFISDWIDVKKSCAMLIFANAEAERWSNVLKANYLDFAYIPSSPLDNSNLESEHIWVAREIAKYNYRSSYSEYDFLDEIVTPDAYSASEIRKHLEGIISVKDNAEELKESYINLIVYLGYDGTAQNINQTANTLLSVLNNYKYFNTYNPDLFKQVCTTIHSAKGLEYKQIIIFADNYRFQDDDNRFLHYVAVTRPEEKLLILCNGRSSYKNYLRKISSAIAETKKIGIDIELDNIIKVISDGGELKC